ncbi:hypothetical protein PIB30_016060 [Stylosanthes scabra]|uniref:PGG domain-containing protein n=1 Tax=Stylosanthes scabra TaxID=79078 RepID=A0ABU6Z4Q6_9FABA|nr:hypothetical protein [Stylosanthes scabra]
MSFTKMENVLSPLDEAATLGDINLLYALIEVDPHILDHIEAIPFVDTPLHVAASAGHVHFAIEIMRLKPSFNFKLNPQGFSPIHLALQEGHKTLVRRLVDIDKELVRVKGREGITPLHFVSQTGDSDLLATFLSACPDSIEDVTVRRETALHVALKYKRFESFQVLVGWLSRNTRKGAACLQYSILNRKDEEGNTILHLSAIHNDLQALDLLIKTKMMELNAQNLEKLTALDKAACKEMGKKLLKAGAIRSSSIEVRPTLADELRSNITARKKVITGIKRIRESMSDSHREAYLVVAALILTAIYQSALSPPGGLYQSEIGAKNSASAEAGKSVLSSSDFFVFSLLNKTVLFLTILLTSLVLIPTGWVGFQLIGPTFSIAFSYLFSMDLISPNLGTQLVDQIIFYLFILVFIWVVIEMVINSLAWKLLKIQICAALRINRLKLKFRVEDMHSAYP